jgi:hypothetical protein
MLSEYCMTELVEDNIPRFATSSKPNPREWALRGNSKYSVRILQDKISGTSHTREYPGIALTSTGCSNIVSDYLKIESVLREIRKTGKANIHVFGTSDHWVAVRGNPKYGVGISRDRISDRDWCWSKGNGTRLERKITCIWKLEPTIVDFGVAVRRKSKYIVGISRDRMSARSGKEDNIHPLYPSEHPMIPITIFKSTGSSSRLLELSDVSGGALMRVTIDATAEEWWSQSCCDDGRLSSGCRPCSSTST